MAKTHTIRLGDKTWEIGHKLNFAQIQIVEPAISQIVAMKRAAQPSTQRFYDEMANVIICAINRVDPKFDLIVLRSLDTDIEELTNAVTTITRLAGMYKDTPVDPEFMAGLLIFVKTNPTSLDQFKAAVTQAQATDGIWKDPAPGEAEAAEKPPQSP